MTKVTRAQGLGNLFGGIAQNAALQQLTGTQGGGRGAAREGRAQAIRTLGLGGGATAAAAGGAAG